MKQFRSQTHLTPDRSGPNVHRQKKSVTKVLVEAVGSVCFFILILFYSKERSGGGGAD